MNKIILLNTFIVLIFGAAWFAEDEHVDREFLDVYNRFFDEKVEFPDEKVILSDKDFNDDTSILNTLLGYGSNFIRFIFNGFRYNKEESKSSISQVIHLDLPLYNGAIRESLNDIQFESFTGNIFIAYASIDHENLLLSQVGPLHIFNELKARVDACKKSGSVFRSKETTTSRSSEDNMVNVSVWQCKSKTEIINLVENIERESQATPKFKEIVIIFNIEFTELKTAIMHPLSENTQRVILKLVSKN